MEVPAAKPVARDAVLTEAFVWALESLCRLHRVPFDAELVLKQFPPPYDLPTLLRAAQACGLKAGLAGTQGDALERLPLPCLGFVRYRRFRQRPRAADAGAAGARRSRAAALSPRRRGSAAHDGARPVRRALRGHGAARRAGDRRAGRSGRRAEARLRLPLVRARARAPPRHLARRAARLARDPDRRPRHAALHAGGDRQGGGAPDAEHADRHRRGAGHLPRVQRGDDLDAPVPRAAYRQPRRRGARHAGVRASFPPAAAVLRASPDRHHGGAPAGRGDDPRIHHRRRGLVRARPAVPGDLPRGDVHLQLAALAHRAGHCSSIDASPVCWSRRCCASG